MRIASAVHVDGQAAVMRHDPVSRHAELRWGGYVRPDGPGSRTAGVAGVPPGTVAFQTVGGRLVPLDPPRPPAGPVSRLLRMAVRRPALPAALLLAALGWHVVGDGARGRSRRR